MLSRHSDPIAAIATAPGRGSVGIVRVSGADVSAVVKAICGRTLKPREATYLAFRDAAGAAIDQGLAIHFPAPHSFTGEDVLELHAHGGNVVLQMLLARCLQAGDTQGMRPAQPGEFSQRAFLNGKIDLAQAEAIADLIDASTETAARSAARSLTGDFSVEIEILLKALTELRMVVEASLDFPEEDVDILQQADARGRVSRLQTSLDQIQQKARQGLLLREGIKVVIAGQPNAGKSSLLNALAGAELAIVSSIAGTTRDKVQQTVQIEGVPVHVIDTAGLRDSADEIEQIGVARTWAEIDAADAILFLHDLVQSADAVRRPDDAAAHGSYQQADARIASALVARLHVDVPIVHVWNKVDLVAEVQQSATERSVHVSAKTGQGLADLRQILLRLAGWQSLPEGVYMARERHLQALQRVTQHVQASARQIEAPLPTLDVLAEELRLAQNALAEITGAFGADDLLGVIFSRFCIGK